MSPPDDALPDGTSCAVPADLRAYSQAAVQIDEQIHQLALRLGRVLDTYRARKPEFGGPIPRIEDDLACYARYCLKIDRRVGQIADAFERAGSTDRGGASASGAGWPVVVAEAALARAVDAETKPAPAPTNKEEHHDHGLLGDLIRAVEHPADTLDHAASAVEHAASDAWGTVEHAVRARLHDAEEAGVALVHGIEHPTETLDAAASGLEKAAGEVAGFGRQVDVGAESAGRAALHALEHPGQTLSEAETVVQGAAADLVGGAEHVIADAAGGLEKAGGALLDAAEHPGDTAAKVASGAEQVANGALHGLEAMGGGILHAIEHPLDTLSNAEQAAEAFVTGFASGVRDMAQAAMLLARVIPGTPMWMASMAIDPEGTVKLQERFARGLAHMVEHPVDTLGNMIDIKDLQNGDVAKWLGHLTPDVIVTVLTAGAASAATGVGEGVAETVVEDVLVADDTAIGEGGLVGSVKETEDTAVAADGKRLEELGRDPARDGTEGEKPPGVPAAQLSSEERFRLELSRADSRPVFPAEWGEGLPNRRGVGLRWMDPANPSGNGVRIDHGDPSSPCECQRVDHVIIRHNGKVMGRDGKPIKGSINENAVNAHVPLSEYSTWSAWYKP
jgi:fructose-specific component phosphotransferase system IIB-like protein